MEWLSETISVGSKLIRKKEFEKFPNEIKIIRDYSFNGFFDAISNNNKDIEISISSSEINKYYKLKNETTYVAEEIPSAGWQIFKVDLDGNKFFMCPMRFTDGLHDEVEKCVEKDAKLIADALNSYKDKTNINQVAMGCKPDPEKFKIKHIEVLNGNTIIIANYGGKTFNGDKLMVLKGEFHEKDLKTLDPHFLNEDYPVFARFKPTKEGMELAKIVAKY